MKEQMNVLIFGSGPIGGSVGAWVAEKHESVYFLDVGPVAEAMKKNGITTYEEGKKSAAKNLKVNVITDISEAPEPDIVCIAVKNYSLDAVSKLIKDKIGDTAIIVGMQNGLENQSILPKYFSNVVYCVICYNAWFDEPGVIGYQKKGPLVLGTPDNSHKFELNAVARIFSKGVETIVTPHLQDAVHSKMIINLTNSLTTLIGFKFKEISDFSVFQTLLGNLTYEGVKIVRAAGYNECKLGGMPGWMLMELSTKLPQFVTRGIFEKNVKKMVISSMAQDIIQRGGSASELDSLNGYFVGLAEEHGVAAPFNRAVYDLCKERFAAPKFEPMDVKEVYEKVKQYM